MSYNQTYWKEHYKNNRIGWDIGYASTPIKEYIDQLTDKSIKILIPGAGNAYEAEYLHKKGFKEVYVLEFADKPVKNLLKRVPDFPKAHLLKQDFFKHKGNYDLIIEQTFFSSLKPDARNEYIDKVYDLLKIKGKFVGLLFDIDFNNDFPPYGGDKEIYKNLFSGKFAIDIIETAYNSIKPRRNNELFVKMIVKK